jgi:hypothetical protein
MSLNPRFRKLFPRSLLLVGIDDDISCSTVLRCALLVAWWRRMDWPMVFLKAGAGGGKSRRDKESLAFSKAGDLVLELAGKSPWEEPCFRGLLARLETVSITLAGSGLDSLLWATAIGAGAAGISAIVVEDAVQARPQRYLPTGPAQEALLARLASFALLMPAMEFDPAFDHDPEARETPSAPQAR